MTLYQLKPVHASQFFPDVQPWPAGVTIVAPDLDVGTGMAYAVDTPKGALIVRPGWWVITGPLGRRKVMDDDEFRSTYEEVDGGSKS